MDGNKPVQGIKRHVLIGTPTNRYRHLTPNLTRSPAAVEDAVQLANFHRVLKAFHREEENTV